MTVIEHVCEDQAFALRTLADRQGNDKPIG